VEEITGDDDVLGRLHRRRVELPPERVQITRVSQVEVGKMAQHTDGTARITSTNDRGWSIDVIRLGYSLGLRLESFEGITRSS
ncbi:MAG TPA: hypothetical protein VM493_02925, partial [Vicinamibacterales bacterium]|nr:hypothetical protein [Vicinamibacterales bacterium]